MSFSSILYTLLIGPLETLFEVIFIAAYKLVHDPGLSIIALSLVMNFLLLPLYRRTDAIQAEAMETEKRMKPMIDHLKRTFKGDERFMMLQTYYRQNNYKPTDVLKGISPLMLEIPFFMAAYHYLSNLGLLSAASFGPIQNLGKPDGLLVIGGIAINVLPILMTVINVASSMIYTKDAPLKTKIQLYGMAALFLVLLYGSPAGLAFYWTLNNLFSLVKNALMKTKKPMLVLAFPATAASVLCLGYAIVCHAQLNALKIVLLVLIALILNVPLVLHICRRQGAHQEKGAVAVTGKDKLSFLCAGLVMTLLLGLMIPSALIRSSPEEFITMGSAFNPNHYVLYTALICAGFFLVWMGLFYALANPSGKKVMEFSMWALCGIAVVDYMAFGRNYGNLSSRLTFDVLFENPVGTILINLAVLVLVTAVLYVIWKKKAELLRIVGIASVLAMAGMSAMNIVQSQSIIQEKVSQYEAEKAQQMNQEISQREDIIHLSQDGKNVVVLMMDRAVNGLLPYIFEEKPELQQQFAGFTYYPNTISFGGHTNIGLPSVFGGYEYMPLMMNKRDQEPLESKHNEALKMMPTLFRDHGYEVTVNDPSYAGYNWIPDLTVFRDCEGVTAQITMGRYNGPEANKKQDRVDTMERKFLFYSLFKASPVFLHEYIYDGGKYQNIDLSAEEAAEVSEGQTDDSTLVAYGQNPDFINSYNVIKYLPELTEITDDAKDTFLMMCNDTTHSPQLLQLPNYEPQMYVDNRHFDDAESKRTDAQGNTITMTKPVQVKHYHCNVASYLQIGKWLDFLRENDVYDNTRIIIVSDHGYNMHLKKELEFGTRWDEDIMFYNPLLLVKDFNSTEFKTDETFMTNADVPTLATQGLIENPVNPFTGKPINNHMKGKDTLYVFTSHEYSVYKNNGNTYMPDRWIGLAPGMDMKDPANWQYLDESQLP